MWFIYQWSGLIRDDLFRNGSEVKLNDRTYGSALDFENSIQYSILKKREEEKLKKEDFDFRKEIFGILDSHIKTEPEFLEPLRKFVEEKTGGEIVITLKGWEVKRVQVKSGDSIYYYWRAFKKNYSPIHIGSALDIEDATQKIDKRVKEMRR